MAVLVTGANGFVGFNLVKRLLHDGYDVVALTKTPLNINHPQLQMVIADVIDVNACLKNLQITVIFHVAARVNFDNSDLALAQLTQDNIVASQQLAKFAVKNNVKKLIYSSSCSVYEENYDSTKWVSEEQLLRPLNTYGVSKLAAEWIMESELKNDVELVSLRYSSIYGFGQRSGSILPIFVTKAINQEPLTIYGSGNRIQDYVHVNDVVEANIKAMDVKLPMHCKLNIGSGEPLTDLDLAQKIKDNWDSSSEISILNLETDFETYLNYDIQKAKNLINYTPISFANGLSLYHHI